MLPALARLLSSDDFPLARVVRRLRGMPPDSLITVPLTSHAQYVDFHRALVPEYQRREQLELALITGSDSFRSEGWCHVCRHQSTFETTFHYSAGEVRDGKRVPNWREHLACTRCGLNNRLRASVHFLERNLGCTRGARIYMTEQTTPLFQHMSRNYPNLTGSEFFGDRVPFGSNDPVTGLRNENVTALTFADSTFDYVLSFDVFEHVPDYQSALRECLRVLKPGGTLLFTVPFHKGYANTLVRARINDDGSIEHLEPPDYHGDPVNEAAGCLCFYTFGWDLISQLRAVGFVDAGTHLYWSARCGYLGGELLLLTASKRR
jgi:SAM-dependent methyltransferase